ncbi:MAG: hypothetical protein HQ495_11760 [Alphaproteobacteria bacterium]|nr:hypothetical protein [Pseudomonadota bacterium]MDA1058363.1 hypothetical protein [Pseudomonadota bacterium]NQV81221.1 hypothetical protein [Alphaproteobacteria bacterium]
MDSLSLVRVFFFVFIWAAFIGGPAFVILGKMGRSRWWVIPTLVPFFGIVAFFWLIALIKWPYLEDSLPPELKVTQDGDDFGVTLKKR